MGDLRGVEGSMNVAEKSLVSGSAADTAIDIEWVYSTMSDFRSVISTWIVEIVGHVGEQISVSCFTEEDSV